MSKLTAPTPEDIAHRARRAQIIETAKQQDANFKAFMESGDHLCAAKYQSMAYLLFSIGELYCEEATDILSRYGFYHKRLKTRAVNLTHAFDLYDEDFSKCICNGGDYDAQQARELLCKDFDTFKESCDRFMNADKRIKHIDAINRDDLRLQEVYLCQVKDCILAPVQLLKWDGEHWLEFVHTPIPKWTETHQIVTHVIDNVRPHEEEN